MINSWTKKNSEFNPTWTKIIVTQQEASWKPSRAVARYLSLIISARKRRSPKASICICRCVCLCECVCVCVHVCVHSSHGRWGEPRPGVWSSSPWDSKRSAWLIKRIATGGQVDHRASWSFLKADRSKEREGTREADTETERYREEETVTNAENNQREECLKRKRQLGKNRQMKLNCQINVTSQSKEIFLPAIESDCWILTWKWSYSADIIKVLKFCIRDASWDLNLHHVAWTPLPFLPDLTTFKTFTLMAVGFKIPGPRITFVISSVLHKMQVMMCFSHVTLRVSGLKYWDKVIMETLWKQVTQLRAWQDATSGRPLLSCSEINEPWIH